MLSSFSQLALLFSLATNFPDVEGGIMVRSMDGSFVPLSFVSRAPGDGIPVPLKNNKDLAYLVSSHRSTGVISEVDKVRYRRLSSWVGLRRSYFSSSSRSTVFHA